MYEHLKKILTTLLTDTPNKGIYRGYIQQVQQELVQYDGKEFEQVVSNEYLVLKSEINHLANSPPILNYKPIQNSARQFILRLENILAQEKPSPVPEPPRVILTWSKPHSRDIATYLREWLPEVLPIKTPWISTKDIQKGKAYFQELMEQFRDSDVLIACITPENVASPWVFYEVGMIASKERGITCPLLIGVTIDQIGKTPLRDFQCTVFDKEDVWLLIRSIRQEGCNRVSGVG